MQILISLPALRIILQGRGSSKRDWTLEPTPHQGADPQKSAFLGTRLLLGDEFQRDRLCFSQPTHSPRRILLGWGDSGTRDRKAFKIYCYADLEAEDEHSRRIKANVEPVAVNQRHE